MAEINLKEYRDHGRTDDKRLELSMFNTLCLPRATC